LSSASSSGIFSHEPKAAPGAVFRESINMGVYKGTSKDLETIIQSLKPHFQGDSYHLLNKNCNSFANEFCTRVVGKGIPGYVNRMANIGSYFSCLLPPQVTNGGAPVDQNGNNGGQASSSSSFNGAIGRRGDRGEKAALIPAASVAPPSFSSSSAGKKLGGTSTPATVSVSSSSSSSGKSNQGVQERRLQLLNAVASRSSGGVAVN
jgi:hypothetical protein